MFLFCFVLFPELCQEEEGWLRTILTGVRLIDLGEGGIVEVRREEKLGGCCADVGILIKIG